MKLYEGLNVMNVSVVIEWCMLVYLLLVVGEFNGLVVRVLLMEVRLILKFGLVDICNLGVYRDMDLVVFECSIIVIVLWMEKFFIMGNNMVVLVVENVLVMLCLLGMVCENDML